PRQNRQPRELDVDYMSWIDPREVTFVAQFDDRQSEESHLAANDIDTAERQLIYVLAKWQPLPWYKPTLYNGMRIQGTRLTDDKDACTFLFEEQQVIMDEPPVFEGEDDMMMEVELEGFDIHVNDPCCHVPCVVEPPWKPNFETCVSGGGCRE